MNKRVTVVTTLLLPLTLVAAGCWVSVSPSPNWVAGLRPKMATPIPACRPGGRLVVAVEPVGSWVIPMVEMNLFPLVNAATSLVGTMVGQVHGSMVGGTIGAVESAVATAGSRGASEVDLDVRDRTPEFTAQVKKILDQEQERLEARLPEAVDRALRPGAQCEFLVFRSTESATALVGPADDLFLAEFVLFFGGKPPAMIARMTWRHMKDATAVARRKTAFAECNRLAGRLVEEAISKRMAPSVELEVETKKACEETEASVDGYDRVILEVPSRSREEWLGGDGTLLRRESLRAIDQTVSKMATQFYGKAPVP